MIFVTGASGMLGSHLIQALLTQQQPVRALYRSSLPVFTNSHAVDWIQGDILDVPLLEDAMRDIQQVYHCAAIVSFQPKREEELYKTNVEGTANVVNACLNSGVKKLLHVSSVAALGQKGQQNEITEVSQWTEDNNSSVYGKTKYLAEMEVWRGVGEGLDAVIMNPGIILGSSDWNSGSAQIFKTAYNEFSWYTDGSTGFVDVLDVVKAALLLMDSDVSAERFIISAENIPYRTLFDMIAEKFGKKKPHREVTPFLAALLWRIEKWRQLFIGSHPLLTKETAASAQSKVFFSSEKLLAVFPQFHYRSLQETVSRICDEFQEKYHLL